MDGKLFCFHIPPYSKKKPFLLQPLIFSVFKNIEFETLT